MKQTLVINGAKLSCTRLKALNLAANGWIQPSNATPNAGHALAALWSHQPTDKPLIIDCFGIAGFDGHSMEALKRAANEATSALVFTRLRTGIAEQLCSGELANVPSEPLRPITTSLSDGSLAVRLGLPDATGSDVEALWLTAHETETEFVKNLVLASFENYPEGELRQLTSTPLLASGVFNARKLLSEPESFIWISLRLADLLDEILSADLMPNACLLGASLRGCPFAAALAFMKGEPLALEIVDHMGPKLAILEEHHLNRMRRNVDYIYVGDFVVGGTELKIAANWAHHRGSRLRYAITIGTWLNTDKYHMPETKIRRLVDLQRLKPGIEYRFGKE